MIRVLDSAGSTLVEWGRQQQHQFFFIIDIISNNLGRLKSDQLCGSSINCLKIECYNSEDF